MYQLTIEIDDHTSNPYDCDSKTYFFRSKEKAKAYADKRARLKDSVDLDWQYNQAYAEMYAEYEPRRRVTVSFMIEAIYFEDDL